MNTVQNRRENKKRFLEKEEIVKNNNNARVTGARWDCFRDLNNRSKTRNGLSII